MKNQGIDPVDTLLGGMGSIFSRTLVWLGAGSFALILGLLGIWMHYAITAISEGIIPIDLDHLPSFTELLKGLLLLPLGWLLMIFAGFTHWVGIIFVPFAIGGTILFLWTEYFEEELFFLNLIISPWATMALAQTEYDVFPWGALVVWVPWTATVIGFWWLRSRSGCESDFREQERVTILSASEILANTAPLVPPPSYDEIHRPTQSGEAPP